MKRRSLLAGASTVVLLAGCGVPVIPRRPTPSRADAAGWIQHRDGRYALHLPRVEMGQNIATALKQVACDELDAPWDAVEVRLLDTRHDARVKGTVGSESVRDYGVPLAQACATLRLALRAGRGGQVLQAQEIPLASLRAFSPQARWVGRPAPQVQGRAIVTGAPLYASDVRLPGMLHARVLRSPDSPALPSRPVAWNEAAARAEPGFVALLRDDRLRLVEAEGLAIVARTPGALDRIEAALAVRWQREQPAAADPLAQVDVDTHLQRGALAHVRRQGSLAAGEPWTVDLQLDVPLAAHAALEPRAAVARVDGEGVELWSGGQDPFYQRDVIARALGLGEEAVRVHGMRAGGAFGGRTLCTVEGEAALLARHLRQPVKVQWTRAQEFAHGFHRPPSSHRIRARVRDGRLADWWHAFCSSHILFTNAAMPPWMQAASGIVGDAGVARGSTLPYACPNQRVEYELVRLPALTGPWRGLGAGPNALAIESAIDECAHAAGSDPLAFRLRHIEDPRLAAVLRAAAADAGWQSGPPRREGRLRIGRGLACGIYKDMSYAAAVAEVALDRVTGQAYVRAFWCAHDCGRVINPDQVRAQTEGNLVWCVGMVLVEALPFANDAVQARTFAEAPIPRISEIPRMQVRLLDAGHAPTGAGETAMVAGAGAVANALRHAAGRRFTRMPVRSDQLLAALAR